jgi:hypothetical protein
VTTNARVVFVVYVIAAGVSWVFTDLRLVLVPTAFVCLVLFVAGFVTFRPLRGVLSLRWPATEETEEPLGTILIDGVECPFAGYEQELIATLRVRHFPELLALASLAATALYAMLFLTVGWLNFGPTTYIFGAELVCIAGWIVLAACLQWFAERRLLGKSHYTIGTILGMDPGFFRRGITYQFFDDRAERRGGRGAMWGGGDYNALLVFYDPREPDKNAPHGGFFFHGFRIGIIPGRHR